jgi:sporadic carbohydrate cluster 2OG-Fe(II) oxygenase
MELTNLDTICDTFALRGFVIIEAEDNRELLASRSVVADSLRDQFSITEPSDEILLNNIHTFIDINDSLANQIVLDTIKFYANRLDMTEVVYNSAKSLFDRLLGPDIACQKNANIVFQYPFSSRFSELHTDAPANSAYEVVAWAPLVNCYDTKSFYLLDRLNTIEMMEQYGSVNKFESWQDFRRLAIANSESLRIDFGSILLFTASLLHGSMINETTEARWSLNTRFKNLFAPSGLKDPLSFYRVFRTSPVTSLALELSS